MNRILQARFLKPLVGKSTKHFSSRNLSNVKKFYTPQSIVSRFICPPRNYSSSYSFENKEWMNEDLFKKVTQNDPELETRVKLLLLEIANLQAEGELTPKKILEKHWVELLELHSYSKKRNYLSFLAKIEFREENSKSRKLRKKQTYQAKMSEINLADHIQYRLGKNAQFMCINKVQLSLLLNLRIFAAEFFKNDIIFDMGFERFMTRRQLRECGKQLLYTVAENRASINPFHFHLCNCPENTLLDKYLQQFLFAETQEFPVTQHRESYLDIFDRDRLVYLTPNSPYDMRYEPDAVYIVGAIIDTGVSLPLSFAKAKSEKIRTARFPLDKYVKWKQGHKSLPLNIVVNIVSDFIYYKRWDLAFRNIPNRLVDRFDEEDIDILESARGRNNFRQKEKEMSEENERQKCVNVSKKI